jgi:hypothetical protein
MQGNGNFTLQVPLPASSFFNGPGDYVLTSVVTNAIGVRPFPFFRRLLIWTLLMKLINSTGGLERPTFVLRYQVYRQIVTGRKAQRLEQR